MNPKKCSSRYALSDLGCGKLAGHVKRGDVAHEGTSPDGTVYGWESLSWEDAGRKGGQVTSSVHGLDHLQKISSKGGQATAAKFKGKYRNLKYQGG